MKKSFHSRVCSLVDRFGRTTLRKQPYYHPSVKKVMTLMLISGASILPGCKKEPQESPLDRELNQLRAAVASYGHLQHAIDAGYTTEVTGYRTHMGYHYLNASLLDDKFEITKPELLLYAPYGNDSLKFVAVEYAIPITDLDNPPPVPEGFTGTTDGWQINTEFKLWTLHVWVGLENTEGIFASHNAKLP